jgi:serine/threonine protein kinase
MEVYATGDKQLGLELSVSVIDQLLDALTALHPDKRRIEEIREGSMSLDQFTELQELQEAGIVHRDVKPANVILSPSNQVKLLDFNIASGVGEPVVTRSGTPPYQPPDLPPSWDPSADLFAVGVMLYQFVTGHHPYPNEEPSAAVTPARAREFKPNLPISLEDFLAQAVAPYAAERFESAVEMREALRQAKRDADLETHSDSLGERVKVFREQNKLSIHDLVNRSGVEERIISEIENRELSPTIAVAKKLAEGLDVPLAALLGERGGRSTDSAIRGTFDL